MAGCVDQGEGKQGWVVLSTHPHKERFALDNLLRQSFPAYCPMIRVSARHARRTRQTLRPIFPGYVFAAVDCETETWRPLLSTFGVRGLVRTGDRPSYLPDGFVAALRAREIEGAIVRPASPYRVGQVVRIVQGAFDGLLATVIDMDDSERLVVLMELLSRPVRVSVDAASVTDYAGSS